MRAVNTTGVWNDTIPEETRRLASANNKKIEEEAIEIVNRGIVFVNETAMPLVQLSLAKSEELAPGY
jgi:hypothetical protein